jgi:hypothetical protein
MAQQPDWSQRGYCYAPDDTAVPPQPTPQEQNEVKEGAYYATSKTIVQPLTPAQLKRDREGDYYAPSNSK